MVFSVGSIPGLGELVCFSRIKDELAILRSCLLFTTSSFALPQSWDNISSVCLSSSLIFSGYALLFHLSLVFIASFGPGAPTFVLGLSLLSAHSVKIWFAIFCTQVWSWTSLLSSECCYSIYLVARDIFSAFSFFDLSVHFKCCYLFWRNIQIKIFSTWKLLFHQFISPYSFIWHYFSSFQITERSWIHEDTWDCRAAPISNRLSSRMAGRLGWRGGRHGGVLLGE